MTKLTFIFVSFTLPILLLQSLSSSAQEVNVDSLKLEILKLRTDVDNIQLNLGKTHRTFPLGIATATLGYSITIAGGQMLGGSNNDLGESLLYVGGAVGIAGTILLINSFKHIGRASGPYRKKRR